MPRQRKRQSDDTKQASQTLRSVASVADVARLAGVSTATVSRVLNNVPWPISSETSEKVLQAAAQLDYWPNHTARALVLGQTRYIGVIVHDVAKPFFAEMVRGVEDAANREGYLVIVCNSDGSVEKELGYVRMLRDFRVAGVIFAGGEVGEESRAATLKQYIAQMKALGAKVVLIGPRNLDEYRVMIQDEVAALEMTNYLLDQGHRRIGHISGPASIPAAANRCIGYCSALRGRGIESNPDLVFFSDFTRAGGRQAAAYFANMDSPPTAIFAGNDDTAIGCIAALKQQGLRVPDDISVAGFGNVNLVQYIDPPLTTVRVPLREMGERAMDTLLKLIKGESPEKKQLVPTELVMRSSSTPPRIR